MLPRLILAIFALAADAAASTIPRADDACTNPAIQKEWRQLTTAEKAEYLRARRVPAWAAQEEKIHFVANFLPWHRWFVHLHEDLSRTECGFTGTQPYWDWSIDADAKDMPGSPIFDPVTGFGGDGKRTGSNEPGFQRCVVDSPFAYANLTLAMGWPNMDDPGNRLHCFTREFNGGEGNDENGEIIIGDMQVSAYNSETMNTIHALDRFADMAGMLEGLPHEQIHSVIFGDMSPSTSPNEPLFFLHHANVHRAWAKWQGRNATRLAEYTGFQDRNKTIPASIADTMPILELGDTQHEPMVKD